MGVGKGRGEKGVRYFDGVCLIMIRLSVITSQYFTTLVK
jgi:hypothetical protein